MHTYTAFFSPSKAESRRAVLNLSKDPLPVLFTASSAGKSMDSCNSWSPSPPTFEPLTSLAPLDSILPSVSLHGATRRGSGGGALEGDFGAIEGDFCSSAACPEGEKDEAGLSSCPSYEMGPMKASAFPSLGDSPQSSDGQYIHDILQTATEPSYAQEEMSAMLSPSESTNCSGFKLAKRAKIEQSGVPYKAPPMSQSQVRKLGEKITALQQLVSPFGKTDTASVLREAIGYIKFLQDQVHVLSLPYMISNTSRKECQSAKDLRSRGLCLVPVSCTLNVASNNGADYWISGVSGCSR